MLYKRLQNNDIFVTIINTPHNLGLLAKQQTGVIFVYQRLKSIFSNQRHNDTNSQTHEIVMFMVVWLALFLMYLFAGFADSNGANRYKLEAQSYTPSVSQPHLINEVCGADFLESFYDKGDKKLYFKFLEIFYDKSDNPAYLNSSNCQGVETQADKAINQLSQVNKGLTNEWKRLSAIRKKERLIANETELEKVNHSLDYRQKWLNLTDTGQLDSINRLVAYYDTYKQNISKQSISTSNQANNSKNTRNTNSQTKNTNNINSNVNRPQQTKHMWSESDLALSLLAVADGNERFPYSVLFKGESDLAQLMNEVASDVNLVYQSNNNQAKASLASRLLASFGHLFYLGLLPQVFIWSLVALVLLGISRNLYHPILIVPLSCVAWGLVLMLVSHDYIASIRFAMILFCVGVFSLVFAMFTWGKKLFTTIEDNRQQLSSPWLYPLFVFFTTFGLWVLVDLSSQGYIKQRYLFLNHFNGLFFCYVLIGFSFLNNYIFAKLIQWFGLNTIISALWSNNLRQKRLAIAQMVLLVVGFLGLMAVLRSDSAKVAELAKMWFIIFMGLFLAVNQRDIIGNLIRSQKTKYFFSFAVVPVLLGLLVSEKGTLFTILFVLIFLTGVAIANKVFHEGGRGNMLGIFFSMALVMILMVLVMNAGSLDDRTAERVLTWTNPFVSTNDQMAIIHWFRDSVPPLGYGLGNIPWCGFSLTSCRGVPLQMQSDYTITSVIAVIGNGLGMLFIAIFFYWLYAGAKKQMIFANQHSKSLHISSAHMIVSWLVLLWVVVTIFQATVTILGNFGILPLTGITLPFLSYGKSSLLFNTFMFGLLLYIPSAKPITTSQNQGAR